MTTSRQREGSKTPFPFMTGDVAYRAEQFFVVANTLTDGSVAFDVCANSDRGDEIIVLDASSFTLEEAMTKCDKLKEALSTQY